MRTRSVLLLTCSLPAAFGGTVPFRHKWDTVYDVMGMHGKFKSPDALPSDEAIAFAARNYPLVATGSGCGKSMTIEDGTLTVARKMKAVNPDVRVGMYWRTDMSLEIAACSNGTEEWNAHKEWLLHDDKGKLALKHGKPMIDYSNNDGAAFFANVLINLMKQRLPSGKPVMNFIYLDGPGGSDTAFAPGVGPARSKVILADKLAWEGNLQNMMNELGQGQNVILNGVDTPDVAKMFAPTGASGVMFDHWSILQFLNRTDGTFNATMMEEAFALARSDVLANMTVEIKGWPGPITHQKDMYPPNMKSPETPADFQRIAAERFNSELALFLLVAEETHYWLYSWFWGFDDWVPDQPDSGVPHGFFPQAKCALGAPVGPPKRVKDTHTWTRRYAHASVFVDLTNRTASRVDFHGGC